MESLANDEHRLQPTGEATFRDIMQQYGTRILRFVYFIVRDHSIAEDITQEVFVKVYRHLPRFRSESSLHTWIYKIAVNECKSYLRSAWFRRMFTRAEIELQEGTSAETEVINKFSRKNIAELVISLPQTYRQVIVLYYYEEMSIAEVAAILGVTEGTVKTRLHRARNQIKKLLEEEGAEWMWNTHSKS